MIFLNIALSVYVVLEYFLHRRELRAAVAAKALAKIKKKPRRPEPQFQPIFPEPEAKASPAEAAAPAELPAADPLGDNAPAPPFHIYCTEATCDDRVELFEFAAVPPAEAYSDLPPLFEARWSRAPAKDGPAPEYRQLGVLNDMSPILMPNP